MNPGSAMLGGFLATLVFTALTAAGQGMGITRMALPFILGTMFSPDRKRAEVAGFLLHLVNGWAFAFIYALVFERFGRAGAPFGAGLGLAHGLVILLVLMPLIPEFHPRMATEEQGPDPTRALEPPGFLGLNYGRSTPLLALAAHVVFGAILGAFYQV